MKNINPTKIHKQNNLISDTIIIFFLSLTNLRFTCLSIEPLITIFSFQTFRVSYMLYIKKITKNIFKIYGISTIPPDNKMKPKKIIISMMASPFPLL